MGSQKKIGQMVFNVGSRMASPPWQSGRSWRMRAEEIRALADEMKEAEPKAIMLGIAGDYEKLAAWAENSFSDSTKCGRT
jgi:hypothetical protein